MANEPKDVPQNPPAREIKPLPGTVPTPPSVTPGPPKA
jgi:hypothetical protein